MGFSACLLLWPTWSSPSPNPSLFWALVSLVVFLQLWPAETRKRRMKEMGGVMVEIKMDVIVEEGKREQSLEEKRRRRTREEMVEITKMMDTPLLLLDTALLHPATVLPPVSVTLNLPPA